MPLCARNPAKDMTALLARALPVGVITGISGYSQQAINPPSKENRRVNCGLIK
jgi:hypothetical protein